MSSLKLKTPSGGSVSFNAEDSASDYTLTVPAGNSTVITGGNIASNLPTGSVLQVVYGETTATTTWAIGPAWKDSGIEATITPSSTSSKIMVIIDSNFGYDVAGVAHTFRLTRNGTGIYGGVDAGKPQGFATREGNIGGRQYEAQKITGSTLDSPASTSALTYKVQHYQHTTGSTIYLNRTATHSQGIHGTNRSSIILMEIAG